MFGWLWCGGPADPEQDIDDGVERAEPTDTELAAASTAWWAEVRSTIGLTLLAALALSLVSQMYRRGIAPPSSISEWIAPSETTWSDRWDDLKGLELSPIISAAEATGVTTAVVLFIATIAVAITATPAISATATAFDRVAVLRWKQFSRGMTRFATAVGIAIAVSFATSDPELAGWILLAVLSVGSLASVTVLSLKISSGDGVRGVPLT